MSSEIECLRCHRTGGGRAVLHLRGAIYKSDMNAWFLCNMTRLNCNWFYNQWRCQSDPWSWMKRAIYLSCWCNLYTVIPLTPLGQLLFMTGASRDRWMKANKLKSGSEQNYYSAGITIFISKMHVWHFCRVLWMIMIIKSIDY